VAKAMVAGGGDPMAHPTHTTREGCTRPKATSQPGRATWLPPWRVRRALHHAYAAVTLLLLATGFLICAPEARGRLLGGFGREILDLHLALGVIMVVLPLAALALAGRFLLGELRRRLGPPDPPWTFRKLHLAVTVVLGISLAASGLLLWLVPGLPLRAYDGVSLVHKGSTWAFALLLPVHLVAARRRMGARLRALSGSEPPVLHEDAEGELLADAERGS
jgi:hypothetical protein